MSIKLAIIGSRNCPPIDIQEHLDCTPDTIISGGARGVDTFARDYATQRGIQLIEYLPEYSRYGRAAPLIRNKDIVDACDRLLVFWDGHSRGTKHVLDYARSQNKPVKIVMI